MTAIPPRAEPTTPRSPVSSAFALRKDIKPIHYDINWTYLPNSTSLIGRVKICVEYFVHHDSSNTLQFDLNALDLEIAEAPTVSDIFVSEAPFPVATEELPALGRSPNVGDASQVPSTPPAPASSSAAVPVETYLGEVRDVSLTKEPSTETIHVSFSVTGKGFAHSQYVKFSACFNVITPISGVMTCRDAMTRSGVYRWTNRDQNHIVTHLEPTHARKLYPCFDDPYFRATYQITLTYPADLVARSCTPEQSEELDESSNLKTVVFEKTISLPSYLIAIAIGDLQSLSAETKRGVKCNIYFSKRHPSGSGFFALDLLSNALQYYEELFQFPLPMKKIDIIAIEDLPVLGMENWGMMTFLEDHCLVHETTTVERRRRIARLIGHEVVHQWFGNLVSLEGWRYIWLKEGMARYMEFVFVHHARPKWQIWTDFLSQVHCVSLTCDCNAPPETAHAVETEPPSNPRQVFDLFDTISYGKGACIVRMVAAALGEERFTSALRNFFKQHAFTSVSSKRLLECLMEAAPANPAHGSLVKPIPNFVQRVSHWVQSVGHPYVLVERTNSGLRVSQYMMGNKTRGFLDLLRPTSAPANDRSPRASTGAGTFVVSTPTRGSVHLGDAKKPSSLPISIESELPRSSFWIPFKLTEIEQGQTSATKQFEFFDQTATFTTQGYAWFHTGGCGPFHCDYDVTSWERILEVYPFFSVLDRLAICMNILELRTFHIGVYPSDPSDRCLLLPKLLQALLDKKENHNYIWSYVAPQLLEVVSLTRQAPVWAVFRTFVLRVTRHLVDNKSVSFFNTQTTDDVLNSHANLDLTSKTATDVLRLLVYVQNPEIAIEAKEYFSWVMSALSPEFTAPEHFSSPPDFDKIEVDRLAVVFECIGLTGTLKEWSAMYQLCKRMKGTPKFAITDSGTDMSGSPTDATFERIEFRPNATLPSSHMVALLCGIFARDSSDPIVASRQSELASTYSHFGGAAPAVAQNTKLLSTFVDGVLAEKPVITNGALNNLLNVASKSCSSGIIGAQLQSIKQERQTAQTQSAAVAILRNNRWVEYITDFYLSFLHRYHARTSSGISVDSGSGSQSIGT
jgi:hypothetical protein